MRFTSLLFSLSLPLAAATTFHFDEATRRYTVSTSEGGWQGSRLSVEIDGRISGAEEATVTKGPADQFELRFPSGLSWLLQFRHNTRAQDVEIESTLHNTGSKALRVGKVVTADAVSMGMGPQTNALIMSGWGVRARLWRMAVGKPHVSKTLTQIYDASLGLSLNAGFVSFDRAETQIEVGWNGRQVTMLASCDLAGYMLQPGASIKPETFRMAIQPDPQKGLDEWADRVAARYHPRIWNETPSGWVGWSWVDPFHIERYEDVVRRNAAAVRTRLPGLDIDYLWISLGNLKDRTPGNWLNWNYDSFPSGPEKLAADLKAQNYKLGLWAGAFWMNEKVTAGMERLNGAFLQYKGQPVIVPHRMLGKMYVPDPTHPKTQSFLKEVFETWRKWGVRYYMIDFLYSISGATPGNFLNDGYYDKSRIQGPEAWREGLRVIREAAGADTYLLTSTGPTLQSIGSMDGVRIGSDYGEGRPLDGPGIGFYPATFVMNKPDYWTSHREGTAALATSAFLHRKLFLADSGNVLTVDQPIPMSEAQISATIFGLNGGPLMLGDDIGRMRDDRLDLIKRVFPRMTDAARALDLFTAVEPDYPKLFHLKVKKSWGDWDLLAVFNFDKKARHEKLPVVQFALDGADDYAVWDYWDQKSLGVSRGTIEVDVLPNTVRLLRIDRARNHPWLLSTDLHVRQGAAEIEDCRWDEASSTLVIRATRPEGDRGSLFLRAPSGWALANPQGLFIAKDGNDGSLIVRKPVEFGTAPLEVRVGFQRIVK